MEKYYQHVPYVDFAKQLTPYNKDHYKSFDIQCAKFVDDIFLPNWDKWEKNQGIPIEIYKKAYNYGVLTPDYPAEYGGQPWKGQKWDFFMDMVRASHLARTGSGAPLTTLYVHKIVIPAILHFGNEYQKQLFRPVLTGDMIGALCISEPGHGSDVARIKCTAKRDGDFYVVNGMKKWISNGLKAKYYLTAVRTGAPNSGAKGISVLIIPKSKNVIVSRITTQGHKPSETALIIFNNVRVPIKNLVGKENQGFKIIMYNFNSERLLINIHVNALAKVCFLEAVKYAHERYTFKKPLIKHQVIRHKIAEMGRLILATHCLLEKLCYRMNVDPLGRNDTSLGSNVALCKVQCTKTLEFVARESSQILGGASYVIGKKIERIYREVRGLAIYGGSEEIMIDLAFKLAMKSAKTISFDNCPMVDWQNHLSPYKTKRQNNWRKLCSQFVAKEILPNVNKWEKNWNVPKDIYKKAYDYGIYGARYPIEYGGTPFEGGGYDQFLNYIMYEQIGRAGSGGIYSSLFIQTISIPPVMHFGNDEQKKLMHKCIKGESIAALAISEPDAGSDVANVQCKAIDNGSGYYIVNGMKKWISNGTKADWFITAVRTNPNIKGTKGISLLMIPRVKGVISSRIKTQGHHTSHTALIIFNNVKVPKSYLLGKEFGGFKMIMYNFNQERFGISCQALSLSKVCIYESIKYAMKRETFGKKLIEHQVIRHKLSEMGRQTLSTYCLMEKLGYALINDPLGIKDKSIPANIALFKVQSTKTLEYCAREASQIFGGASYVEGNIIDKIYRDVRAFAIYGGSEEIMNDVSVRLSKL